jgi:hypothetical protein
MIGFAVRSIAAAALAGIAVAVAGGPESGKYCVFGKGNSYECCWCSPGLTQVWVSPFRHGRLAGSNFGVGGIAPRSGIGWAYRDQMNSPDPDQRCGVDILGGKGTYRVSTVEGARCEAMAGHGAVLYGTDVFPLGTRVGPAPPDFLEGENLTRIGCDQPRHRRRRP